MPIALQTNAGVAIHGMPCVSTTDRSFLVDSDSSSSSSSIGRNSESSESSSDREDSGEHEVQSSFKGPLDTIKNALEEVLPVKRSISKFYSGKSKSFTSLSDASCATSIQDIVKPEDPYIKKRRNLLAHNIFVDRSCNCSDNGGGISKRPANKGGGTSFLTLSSLSSNSNSEEWNCISTSPPCSLPPLHPHAIRSSANESPSRPPTQNSPWRSYSWSDLQSVAAEAHDISGLTICSGNKGNKVN